MSREIIYKCDNCGIVRGPSNNWFIAVISTATHLITVAPFNENDADGFGNKLLCGEECVHKFISQNLISLHPKAKIELMTPIAIEPEKFDITNDLPVQVIVPLASSPDDDIPW